jgi:hypothetical protein
MELVMGNVRMGVFCTALACAGYLLSDTWQGMNVSPRLEISPEVDIGELRHDEEVSLAIGFRNVGKGLLRVQPPLPGCACAAAELTRSEFRPGETGSFRFKLRPARPAGTEFLQEVIVPSNDPLEPRRSVLVIGHMASSLVSSPQQLRLRGKTVGQPWTERMIVECTDRNAVFEITSLTCDLPEFHLDSPYPISSSDDRKGSVWQLDASYVPDQIGRRTGEVLIQTNHPRYNTLRIPISIDVPSQLAITPASLLFIPSESPEPQVVRISSSRPFELGFASDDNVNGAYDIQLSQEDAANTWLMAIQPRSGHVDSIQESQIRLTVSGLEKESEVTIPVTALPSLAVAGADGE